MSAQLAGLGVAHVIPESMGGVAATVRLLREGIIIPSGPMAGSPFRIPHIADEEIENVEEYLRIVYDYSELRLEFHDPEDTGGASGPIFYSQSP
ncbi:MAG: hypothetical protein KDM91_06775 [Verrucomicrobiae bacterium]|nr:hypothetical protein [Verrucomicrobiae bacterium]